VRKRNYGKEKESNIGNSKKKQNLQTSFVNKIICQDSVGAECPVKLGELEILPGNTIEREKEKSDVFYYIASLMRC